MPPTKKKAKKFAVSSSNAEPSSSGSADPAPVQKKRGRPRKVVKDESTETTITLASDYKSMALSSSAAGAAAAATSEKYQVQDEIKRSKIGSAAGVSTVSTTTTAAGELENGKILSSSETLQLIKKPPGRRRKSEPHRAPGVLIEGLL